MKRFLKSLASVFLAVFMVASLTVIPSSAAPSLNKTSVTLTKGYQTTLSVSGSSGSVTWSTGDKTIATVSKGKVVGKGVGTTYIYAKVSNTTLKCKVKVVAAKITASSSSVYLDKAGDTKTVTMTVKGSHKNLAVGSTNKKVATAAFVKPVSWDGDKIKITITAKGAGSARIKVYLKDYSSSCYKYIDVDVDDDGNIGTNDTNTSSGSIAIMPYTNNVEVASGGTYTLQVYCSNQSSLAYSLTSSNIASVSAGNASGLYRNYTIKGVNPGTTSLRLYDKNNTKNYYDVKITVGGSQYYEFYTTQPAKMVSTDQIIDMKVNSVQYYMIVPQNYDVAYVNSLISQKFNAYEYYKIYDRQPNRMASGDTYHTFYHTNNKYTYGARYVLLPKDYDAVKLNTEVARYNGSYEYYTVYNERPIYRDSWDILEQWTVRDSKGYTISRYMIVPNNSYDQKRVDRIKEEDQQANNTYNYYTPYDKIPNVNAGSGDVVIWYTKNNVTKYMIVPSNNSGLIKANDAIYKDTGIYEYNVRYSTSPTAGDGEAVAIGRTGSTTVYILYKISQFENESDVVTASANNYADGIK